MSRKTKQNLKLNRTVRKQISPLEGEVTMKHFKAHEERKWDEGESTDLTMRVRKSQESKIMQPHEQI